MIKARNKYTHNIFKYIITVSKVRKDLVWYTYDDHDGRYGEFSTNKEQFLRVWRRLTKLERALK